MSEALFRLDAVTKTYRSGATRVVAVDDVSLAVTQGQRLGIVGESGSGKSTLIRMMAALIEPTSGEVRFRDERISHRRESERRHLRSQVQLVFQDPRSSLNPRMTVGDIVGEPLRSLRGEPDVPRDHDARVAEVLAAVDLPTDAARRYPHEFSGGQRQRIAIARALAPAPRIVIADEPVSALDVSVRAQVLNLLDDLIDTMGLTLVFVSHDLAVVRHVCPDLVVMRDGRIVEAGSTERIWADPQEDYTRQLLAAIPRMPA